MNQQTRMYVPQLDSLRAIAIAAVLFTHLWGYPKGSAINVFAAFGWAGVDLFFVLSGFLITGILRDTQGDPKHFRNFYARRILRIMPLYYLLLVIVFVALPAAKELPEVLMQNRWLYWLHLGNFALAKDGWQLFLLDITWSLSLEEQFYLLWPALLYRLSNRQVIALCSALIIGMPVARMMLWEDLGWMWLHMLLRADSFAAGAVLAVAIREGINVQQAKWFAMLWIPIFYLVGTGQYDRESQLVASLGYSLNAIAAGGLLLVARESELFKWKPAAYVGKVSYGVYIYHPLCLAGASMLLPSMSGVTQLALVSVIAVAVASASHYVYERPILKFKDYFPGATTPLMRSVVRSTPRPSMPPSSVSRSPRSS